MLTSTELSSSDESNKSAFVLASLVRSINSCSREVCFVGHPAGEAIFYSSYQRHQKSFRAGPAFFLGSYRFMICLQRVHNKVHFIHYSLVLVGAISTYYVSRHFSWCELPSSEDF